MYVIMKLQQGGPTTTRLQRVNIYIADQNYCKDTYKKMGYNVYNTQVCAYDATVMKGSCHVSCSLRISLKSVLALVVRSTFSTHFRYTYGNNFNRSLRALQSLYIHNETDTLSCVNCALKVILFQAQMRQMSITLQE